ncbi:triose-phosphate isomerase [Microbacterium sp. E-13]|uniref:triose-phosphate isomerase n=1 Tax=Microbacterium sp. E-13 TaxID=3404048 RepID=UPI003CEB8A3D
MTPPLTAPFFEIGPKNLLRRHALEELALAAGRAGAEYGVSVVVTVPTVMIAPIVDLDAGVHVFAQSMDADRPGASFARVTAEGLVDAGAAGVMLDHDAAPLDERTLAATVARAKEVGLATIVCAGSESAALAAAALAPAAVLVEPANLIGTAGAADRGWIAPLTSALRRVDPRVLAMHAGGVSSPGIVRAIMATGADATGSTSGILGAPDPLAAARLFIAAARAGWDVAHAAPASPAAHPDHDGPPPTKENTHGHQPHR